MAPTGKSRRDQIWVSSQAPSIRTGRVPNLAFSTDASGPGANTERSSCGRRPIAATRSDTILIGRPDSRRLKDEA